MFYRKGWKDGGWLFEWKCKWNDKQIIKTVGACTGFKWPVYDFCRYWGARNTERGKGFDQNEDTGM